MITLEICCGSFEDAITAERAGASRIELNSALALGGLTPDIGDLYLCKEKLHIPVMAMLRPRAGGFCYTEREFCSMQKSAEVMLKAGADGLVFGILTPDRQVDVLRTKILVNLAHSCGKEAVFHRAFDCVENLLTSAEDLLASGVDRVLTSGGAATAREGSDMLHLLQQKFGNRLEILAGSGVRSSNVIKLIEQTGISQIHSSCRGMGEDLTARGNRVSFALQKGEKWYAYECVDGASVHAIHQAIVKYEGEGHENL